MPPRIAVKEYEVLRRLEDMGLPAVRPAGLVLQPEFDTAILVTRYLEGSWQYRRLFMRLPPDQPKHRARLFDAMAGLLVELHRHGVFWGDCSLANTLFSRDGQVLQAWLVDAETSEVHPTLSRGQRELDIDILVENVAAGLVDLAERLGRPDGVARHPDRGSRDIAGRYSRCGKSCMPNRCSDFADRYRVEGTVRRLNDLGFAVDEVSLQPVGADPEPNSRFMSPSGTGATTRSICRSSPAWTWVRGRPASCSAICTPIRRSCAGKRDRTLTSRRPHGCG